MKEQKVLFIGNDKVEEARRIGNLIAKSVNNPEYGTIMVETNAISIGTALNRAKRNAFIFDTIDNLEWMVKEYNLTPNSDYSKKIAPVRLIVQESIMPEEDWGTTDVSKLTPKIYPDSHDLAGDVITHDGSPVYRRTEIVEAGSEQSDVLLKSDRVGVSSESVPKKDESSGELTVERIDAMGLPELKALRADYDIPTTIKAKPAIQAALKEAIA